jgi:hypothetical protein
MSSDQHEPTVEPFSIDHLRCIQDPIYFRLTALKLEALTLDRHLGAGIAATIGAV